MSQSPRILFQEDQRFRNPYVWTFLLLTSSVILGSVVWLLVRQFGEGRPVGGEPMPPAVLLGLGAVIVATETAVLLFVAALRLQTEVTEAGLFLRLAPVQRKVRRIDIEGVIRVEVEAGNSVARYGGIGIRRNRRETAYLLHGQGGVRIDYANGCHVFIGSYRPELLGQSLRQVTGVR